MPPIDESANKETLDSLRAVQRKLYAIPGSELDAMSPEDQTKYGDSLHQCGLAILELEAAQLKAVNDAFKAKEEDLRIAAANLEKDAAALADAIQVIGVVSDGIKMITNIVNLLK